MSWANLFMLPEWLNLHSPSDEWSRYEFPTRYAGATIAVILMYLALATLYWAATELARRSPKAQSAVRFTALLLLLIPLNRLRDVLNVSNVLPVFSWLQIRALLPLPLVGALCAVGLGAAAYFAWRGRDRFAKTVDLVFALFIPFAFITLVRSMGGYLNGDLDQIATNRPFHEQHLAPKNRVVWLVFDELDYRLVFEQRPPQLKVPAWDKLLSESLSFTNAYPPSNSTTISIPSMTVGRKVSNLSPEGLNNALLSYEDSETPSEYWKTAPTIFKRMQEMHANTAIIGWFHGYCGIFGALVQSCDRASRSRYAYEKQLSDNFLPLLQRAMPVRWTQEVHISSFNRLREETLKTIADPRYQFVYGHLPVPHPPFIYDTEKQALSRWVSFTPANYFGNVQLTDKLLGEFREALESAGSWEETTLIITSDHHWRGSPDYDGSDDLRIPLIVKLPGRNKALRVAERVSNLGIYEFALRAIQGKSLTPRAVREHMVRSFSPKLMERATASHPSSSYH